MNRFDPKLQRAWMLLQQSRYQLAEQELRQALADQPNNGMVHSLLALTLSSQERHQEANDAAETAVGLAPDEAFAHFVHSRILAEGNCLPEAEGAVRRAIEIDSHSASYFAQLAAVLVQQKRWPAALEAAELGLEVDSEHDGCANLRAIALNGLRRPLDAADALRGALERDPDDAWTHANLGWTLLEKGQANPAMEHFREALRLEPDQEYARQGIITAMKARSILYRPLLNYFLWIKKFSAKYQWGIIIGFLLLSRFVDKIGDKFPAWKPWTTALLVIYVLFVLTTWLGNALFNLVLSLDPFGRLVLSIEEKRTSLMVGVTLLVAVGLFVFSFFNEYAFFASVGVLAASLPMSLIYHAEEGWPRRAIVAMTVALMAMGLCPLVTVLLIDFLPEVVLIAMVIITRASINGLALVALGSQILSQLLVARRPRRITPKRV